MGITAKESASRPPPNYRCHICKLCGDHWIMQCNENKNNKCNMDNDLTVIPNSSEKLDNVNKTNAIDINIEIQETYIDLVDSDDFNSDLEDFDKYLEEKEIETLNNINSNKTNKINESDKNNIYNNNFTAITFDDACLASYVNNLIKEEIKNNNYNHNNQLNAINKHGITFDAIQRLPVPNNNNNNNKRVLDWLSRNKKDILQINKQNKLDARIRPNIPRARPTKCHEINKQKAIEKYDNDHNKHNRANHSNFAALQHAINKKETAKRDNPMIHQQQPRKKVLDSTGNIEPNLINQHFSESSDADNDEKDVLYVTNDTMVNSSSFAAFFDELDKTNKKMNDSEDDEKECVRAQIKARYNTSRSIKSFIQFIADFADDEFSESDEFEEFEESDDEQTSDCSFNYVSLASPRKSILPKYPKSPIKSDNFYANSNKRLDAESDH